MPSRGDDHALQKGPPLQVVVRCVLQQLLCLGDDAAKPRSERLLVVDDHVAETAVRARHIASGHLALGVAQALGVRPTHLVAERVDHASSPRSPSV